MEASIRKHLQTLSDPLTQEPIKPSAIMRCEVQTKEGQQVLSITLQVGYPVKGYEKALQEAFLPLIRPACPSIHTINLSFETFVVAHKAQMGVSLLPTVRNIIAVASGKGGVGKSTTTVNIALAMAKAGARVGILDADIYGPSIPHMLGVGDKRPQSEDGKTMNPIEAHGLQTMSIGFMIDVETPMIWRGPMVSQALDQLIRETAWQDLDYLFVDMPPGTGDVQLTMAQKVPLTGAVIVTTPQDIALLDARKGLKMFEKVGVTILGLVENMSIFECPKCSHCEPIFGEGGAQKMGEDYKVAVLGQLPLAMAIRAESDSGTPTVIQSPNGKATHIYQSIAHKIALSIAKKAQSFDNKIPNIVIQNT